MVQGTGGIVHLKTCSLMLLHSQYIPGTMYILQRANRKVGVFTPSAIPHHDFSTVSFLLLDVLVLPIPFRPVLLSGEDGAQRQRGGQRGGANPHLMTGGVNHVCLSHSVHPYWLRLISDDGRTRHYASHVNCSR